jgi:hypothetical protein
MERAVCPDCDSRQNAESLLNLNTRGLRCPTRSPGHPCCSINHGRRRLSIPEPFSCLESGQARHMCTTVLPFILIVLFTFLGHSAIAAVTMFKIDDQKKISARITNAPLQDVLKDLCSTFNVEIKRMPHTDEMVSLTITEATLDEALKRLLRGYNYVYMQDAEHAKPAIIVFGKTERSKYAEESSGTRQATMEPPNHVPAPIQVIQQRAASASSQTHAPVQNRLSVNTASAPNPQRKNDEEKADTLVTSAGPFDRSLRMQGSSAPPMAGPQTPPVPAPLHDAKTTAQSLVGTQPTSVEAPPQTAGENSSGQISPEAQQEQPSASVDLHDLIPPSIPAYQRR